ncbi:MAG: capsid cement protein [Phycisphaerae bacterium]
MALSANREVDHYIDQELRSLQVAADTHIYKGALIGLASGYARPLTAGDLFVGIAYEEMDNTGGSAGDKSVRIYTLGDFGHALSGAAVTNIGDAVYASADDTLTFTSTSNSYVGHAVDVPASGQIILRLDSFRTQP